MHQRRAGRKRRFEVDHRVERIGVEHDVGGGVLGQVAAVGHHHRDRLADVAHLAARERHLRARVKDEAVDRRRRHQQRSGPPVGAEVLGGEHGVHAGPAPRGRDVDAAQARMRERRAHEGDVEEAVRSDVVDEERPAGQQTRVLVARDGCAEVAGRHHRLAVTRSL